MRVLDQKTKAEVWAVINANMTQLRAIEGFVSAEPGFPIIDGTVHKEPAVIVFVRHKKPPASVLTEERVPRQFGPYRVAVMQAEPLRQVMTLMSDEPIAASVADSASGLTYEPIPQNPIDKTFRIKKPILCHVGPDAGCHRRLPRSREGFEGSGWCWLGRDRDDRVVLDATAARERNRQRHQPESFRPLHVPLLSRPLVGAR